MNLRATIFGMAVLAAGLTASATFGQQDPRFIPAMPGADVSAAFDGGTCAGRLAIVDGGCLLQLRKITEADGRTQKLTSPPTPATCGQTVTIAQCPLTCVCPAASGPKPAPAKPAPPARKR